MLIEEERRRKKGRGKTKLLSSEQEREMYGSNMYYTSDLNVLSQNTIQSYTTMLTCLLGVNPPRPAEMRHP